MPYELRPIVESDLEVIFEWRNSDRIRRISFSDHLITWEEHSMWFKNLQNDSQRRVLVFEENQRPIGTVNFLDIDMKNQRCRWGFYLGEDDLKKGTGTQMGIRALDYAFNSMKVVKVCAEAFDWNETSIAYHLKLGFHREGLLKKHQMKDGQLQDIVIFGLSKEDWLKRRRDLGAK